MKRFVNGKKIMVGVCLSLSLSAMSPSGLACFLVLMRFFSLFLGDLIWMKLPGMSMLVVNNLDIAHDLLSRKSSLNSGRSMGYMMNETYVTFVHGCLSPSSS
jgi:uncharacterized SAM-binding protein YcdF (DUF218 family)